jgi:DNA helicase-2/ATP-dependent DNA helicase PcrA
VPVGHSLDTKCRWRGFPLKGRCIAYRQVTLTTYHAAKGREWPYVILPGLIDGVMPRRRWSKPANRFVQAVPDDYEQDRRAFYVGLTRAKRAVILIEGDHWLTNWGAPNRYGVSPFARMIRAQLGSDG